MGWGLYENILDDYLSWRKRIQLSSKQAVFKFFLGFWDDLHEHYSLVDDQAANEESPFADLDSNFLVVSPGGIFHVTDAMPVLEVDRFYAIGSGKEYAFGALDVLYEQDLDPAALATRAVQTAIRFDSSCGGEIVCDTLKLKRSRQR